MLVGSGGLGGRSRGNSTQRRKVWETRSPFRSYGAVHKEGCESLRAVNCLSNAMSIFKSACESLRCLLTMRSESIHHSMNPILDDLLAEIDDYPKF